MTTWKIVSRPQGGHTLIRTDDSDPHHPITSMPLLNSQEVLDLQDVLEQHTYEAAWENASAKAASVAAKQAAREAREQATSKDEQ